MQEVPTQLQYATPVQRDRTGIVVLAFAIAFVHVTVYSVVSVFTEGGRPGVQGFPAVVNAVFHPVASAGEALQRHGVVDFPRGRLGSLTYIAACLADSLLYGFGIAICFRRLRRRVAAE